MSFHEVRFPTAISLNSEGGPTRRTEIVSLASGFEERNTPWAHSRRRYNAGYGVKSASDIEAVIAFFEARRGRLYGFRWRDPFDWKSSPLALDPAVTDQPLGTGDGTTTAFQLKKRYDSGGVIYERDVKKPVSATVLVAIDGAPQSEGGGFTVDAATGLVTFTTAPSNGAVLTAGYEFDTPVRFDTDELSVARTAFEAGDIANIPLIEVLV